MRRRGGGESKVGLPDWACTGGGGSQKVGLPDWACAGGGREEGRRDGGGDCGKCVQPWKL